MEQHKYNIIDIARLAQVSTATVSRVLHEKGGYSKETETRVRRVIAECGFQLNKNAQGLRTQRSRNIGVIVPDITNEFFARIIRYLELFFLKHQYSVLICDSHEDIEIEQLHIRNLKEQQVEGIIYISGRNANPIQESAFSSDRKAVPQHSVFKRSEESVHDSAEKKRLPGSAGRSGDSISGILGNHDEKRLCQCIQNSH